MNTRKLPKASSVCEHYSNCNITIVCFLLPDRKITIIVIIQLLTERVASVCVVLQLSCEQTKQLFILLFTRNICFYCLGIYHHVNSLYHSQKTCIPSFINIIVHNIISLLRVHYCASAARQLEILIVGLLVSMV